MRELPYCAWCYRTLDFVVSNIAVHSLYLIVLWLNQAGLHNYRLAVTKRLEKWSAQNQICRTCSYASGL